MLPGLGATLAVFRPGDAGIPTQLATVFGAGYAVVSLVSTALVLVGVLTAASFFTSLLAITVILWYVGLKKSGPRARVAALTAELRANPWPLATGFAFVVGLALVLSNYSGVVNFGSSNPFRYWADGLEIASAGQVPEASLQWGDEYPPTVNKLVFNSFNAAVSYAVAGPLAAMGALTFLCLLGLPVAAWAAANEMGLRHSALALAVMFGARLFLGHVMAFVSTLFAGEIFGLMVATCGLAVGLHALRSRGGRAAAMLSGVLFGAAAGTHLVPTVVMLTLLGWHALSRVAIERDIRRVLGTTAVVLGLSFAIAGSTVLLSNGDLGFGGAGSDRYSTAGGFDPTLFFVDGRIHQDATADPETRSLVNDGWYDRPTTVLRDHVEKSLSLRLRAPTPLIYLLPTAIAVATIGVVLWFPRELKPIAVMATGLWVSLLCFGLFFSLRYDTYIPARFPNRRLYAYGSLALVLLGMVLLEAALRLFGRVRSWAAPVAATLLVAVAAAIVLPSGRVSGLRLAEGRQSLAAMSWVRTSIPCDARIVASQRSAGTFQAMTGRVAVTEGMAPYVRPAILTGVIDLLVDARRFFRDPAKHKKFLVNQGIDHVVVLKEEYLLDKHPQLIGPVDERALSNARFLEPVHNSELMDVYRVRGVQQRAGFPDPADFPGYSCGRTPLESASGPSG